MDPVVFVLAPIVLLAYTAEALTGFGATVVAVTLGSHFYPIDKLVPALVTLNVVLSYYIAVRYRRGIHRQLLVGRVFPLMVIGVAAGFLLYPLVSGPGLKRLLGLMVTVYAGRELYLVLRKTGHGNRLLGPVATGFWLILAGITHAFYSTGGPMLVYVVGRLELAKEVFRATMSMVWAVMATILIVVFLINGRINAESATISAGLVPSLLLGIVLGEWFHGRISEYRFRLFIYILLLFSGSTLLF